MPDQGMTRAIAGGAATAAGMDFQARVAAWFATRILAEDEASVPWSWPPTARLEFLRCETEQPVDDILLGTSEGGHAFVQVKHSISLERGADSALGKTVNQFVRQFNAYRSPSQRGRQRWERPFDSVRDRLVLVVGKNTSRNVTAVFPSVLERLRSAPSIGVDDIAQNNDERDAFAVFRQHVEQAWANTQTGLPTEADLREFLEAIRIWIADVEPDGTEELGAKSTLRRSVLANPAEDGKAWAVLINECTRFSVVRSGGAREDLQRGLSREGILLQNSRGYSADIRKLQEYSQDSIAALELLAEIRVESNTPPIKIHRPATERLKRAATAGSLLVIGEPGAGKSGMLYDAASALASEHDVFLLATDRLEATSSATLQHELRLEHDLVEVLRNWQGSTPAFFITDALDAARSDYAGRMLREVIGKVLRLGSRWRVIASIRKYDLRHSPELRSLFAGDVSSEDSDPDFVGSRHFLVRELTLEECEQVITQSASMGHLLGAINSGADSSIRKLARNPFNLRLLGELVGAGEAVESLSPIETQSELLERYWGARIIQADHRGDVREVLIRRAAEKMVENRLLRVRRSDVVGHAGESGIVLNEILSINVLHEWRSSPDAQPDRYTLAFTHHILFDYAVARLLFREEPVTLVVLIASDPEMVVAFRPSLVLHFRHEWELSSQQRERFWALVFLFTGSSSIPLIGRVIGPSVAAEMIADISGCAPLLARLTEEDSAHTNAGPALEIFRHLVGALAAQAATARPLVGLNAPPWCELAAQVAGSVGISAYALRVLLLLLSEYPERWTPEQCNFVGIAARSLLAYVWNNESRYDLSLARSGIESVCR